MNQSPFFLFDVESIGLHGEGFAVAGGLYLPNGQNIDSSEFCFSCPPEVALGRAVDRKWVEENVPEIEVTHKTPVGIRAAFWERLLQAQKDYPQVMVAAECGWPVEARFLNACIKDDNYRQGRAPYPLHEVSSIMLAAGLDSQATYERLPSEMPKHHPLKDVRQTARLLSMSLAKCTRFWL